MNIFRENVYNAFLFSAIHEDVPKPERTEDAWSAKRFGTIRFT